MKLPANEVAFLIGLSLGFSFTIALALGISWSYRGGPFDEG